MCLRRSTRAEVRAYYLPPFSYIDSCKILCTICLFRVEMVLGSGVKMPQAEIGWGTSLRLRVSILFVFPSTLPSRTLQRIHTSSKLRENSGYSRALEFCEVLSRMSPTGTTVTTAEVLSALVTPSNPVQHLLSMMLSINVALLTLEKHTSYGRSPLTMSCYLRCRLRYRSCSPARALDSHGSLD